MDNDLAIVFNLVRHNNIGITDFNRAAPLYFICRQTFGCRFSFIYALIDNDIFNLSSCAKAGALPIPISRMAAIKLLYEIIIISLQL